MKNIYTLLVGIIFWFSFNTISYAQQRPTITPLTGGFTFPNQIVEEHPVAFRANSTDCAISFTRYYKYYSFKANFDMVFAFDLIANTPDFRFVIWKLNAGQPAESIFENTSTIRPNRTVENGHLNKGMAETEAEICESYSTPNNNGYVRAFAQEEILKKDETVVIAVYGNRVTDTFDLKINVAEERTLDIFNTRCQEEGYSANEILNGVIASSGSSMVTLYRDAMFQEPIGIGENLTTPQTIYAQVKDATGKLIYIYTIPIVFRPNYTFQITPIQYKICGYTFNVNADDIIRKAIGPSENASDFRVNWVEVYGSQYENGQNIYLGERVSIATAEITYLGRNACPTTTTFTFEIINVEFEPTESPRLSTCSETYEIQFEELKRLLSIPVDYDFRLYASNGQEIVDGTNYLLTHDTTVIQYEVIHQETGCVSARSTFEIVKLSALPIVDVSLTSCLEDLSREMVQQKIEELKNGTNARLNYYYSGQMYSEEELYALIATQREGRIEARIAEGCEGMKYFNFLISESSISIHEENFIHAETCQAIETTINFNQEQLIGLALQNLMNPQSASNYEFKFFDELGSQITTIENLNAERRLKVIVNKIDEACTTSYSLILKRYNQPVVSEPANELTASCDQTITFTTAQLVDLFGADITRYQYSIELNRAYPLSFNGTDRVIFPISFYEEESCQVTKELVILKGADLDVDVSVIQQTILANPYRFCGTIQRIDVEIYLENYINQILGLYPNLRTADTIASYANQMIANDGEVVVVFNDPLQCGTKEVRFTYSPYPMPQLELDSRVIVCTDEMYVLELSDYTTVRVWKETGEEIFGTGNRFGLTVGNYTVEVTNEYGCTISKTIQVVNAPLPIITEIVLKQDAIEVIVDGNGGTLEYSLDGRHWQTSNQFTGIQKGISYTVYVRENGCSTVSIPDVVYLNLPNFISPNGDGKNDFWEPIGAKTSLDVRIKIFNRYGKVVYEAEGPNALQWDGTNHGKPLASDSYWYFIEYIDQKAVIKLKYQGYITIKSHF